MLAVAIDPTMTEKMWACWRGRMPIAEVLQAPKIDGRSFAGTIANIRLVEMDNAYYRMHDANCGDEWEFIGKNKPGSYSDDEVRKQAFRGFAFTADALSAGRGLVGQIQALLWYGPVPAKIGNRVRVTPGGEVEHYQVRTKITTASGGMSVQRYVTKPKVKTGDFEQLADVSRRVAHLVLAGNPLARPLGKNYL